MKSKIAYLTLCLALAGCGNKTQIPQASNEYAVREIKTTECNLSTSYPATIKGIQDIEIRPKVSGFITKVHVDEGDFVRRGQVLFSIDRVQYEAAVKSAEAAVRVARTTVSTQKLTVKNKKMLHEKKIISDYDMEMAENQLASAEAQLASARAQLIDARNNLSFCSVTSPSDGVVGTIPYRVGSLVSSSTAEALTTVSNISKMYVYFSMTEKQLLEYTKGTDGVKGALAAIPAVSLQLADGSTYNQTGKVTNVNGVIDIATGSVSMRATFDNPQKILRSGGSGSVVFPIHMDNAILVPQKATYEIQDKHFVYVVGKDNKVKNTEITVLPQNDGTNFVVTGGLKAGERIVVEGVNTLSDGMAIKPISEAQSAANRRNSAAQSAAQK
ncbi:MAG TPA: efflux RND transporter periplasmic adaptor subunit [Candidatus Caccomonas pullistercoris]|nr:efflux RND transporter periplasmic adaptor subunit [Candidatus Caccomonas pullistercoris]